MNKIELLIRIQEAIHKKMAKENRSYLTKTEFDGIIKEFVSEDDKVVGMWEVGLGKVG